MRGTRRREVVYDGPGGARCSFAIGIGKDVDGSKATLDRTGMPSGPDGKDDVTGLDDAMVAVLSDAGIAAAGGMPVLSRQSHVGYVDHFRTAAPRIAAAVAASDRAWIAADVGETREIVDTALAEASSPSPALATKIDAVLSDMGHIPGVPRYTESDLRTAVGVLLVTEPYRAWRMDRLETFVSSPPSVDPEATLERDPRTRVGALAAFGLTATVVDDPLPALHLRDGGTTVAAFPVPAWVPALVDESGPAPAAEEAFVWRYERGGAEGTLGPDAFEDRLKAWFASGSGPEGTGDVDPSVLLTVLTGPGNMHLGARLATDDASLKIAVFGSDGAEVLVVSDMTEAFDVADGRPWAPMDEVEGPVPTSGSLAP